MTVSAIVLISCSFGPAPTPSSNISLLYVLNATAGTLAAVSGTSDMYTLTLTGVSKSTVYFADRPAKVAGHIPTDMLVKNWGAGKESFKTTPPNAALDIVGGADDGDVLAIQLSEPTYSESAGQMTYRVQVLKDLGGTGLLSFNSQKDAPANIPAQFAQAALFIDASYADISQVISTRSCRNCSLTGANFSYLDLSGGDLSGSDLSLTFFAYSNLSNANMSRTRGLGGVFINANLSGANFTGSDFEGANMSGANKTGCINCP